MSELTDLQHELLLVDVNVSGIGDVAKRASDEIGRLREMLDTRIQACELRVDDKVILSITKQISMESAARLRESFSNALGVSNRIVVLEDGLSVSVMRPTKETVPLTPMEQRVLDVEMMNDRQEQALGRCDDG